VSGTERASGLSFGITSVSSAQTAGGAFGESGSVAVRTGQIVVKVDAIFIDTQFDRSLTLGGEVLGVGGAAGVADQGCRT
jgi:hypothetical protein